MLSHSWRIDHGVVSAMLVAVLGVTTLLISMVGFAINFSVEKQKIQLVADADAMILSETSRGLIAGFSCEKAGEYAKTFDMDLDSCRIVSSVASVKLSKWFGPFRLEANASAGPS